VPAKIEIKVHAPAVGSAAAEIDLKK
jgi:hypothetical protein